MKMKRKWYENEMKNDMKNDMKNEMKMIWKMKMKNSLVANMKTKTWANDIWQTSKWCLTNMTRINDKKPTLDWNNIKNLFSMHRYNILMFDVQEIVVCDAFDMQVINTLFVGIYIWYSYSIFWYSHDFFPSFFVSSLFPSLFPSFYPSFLLHFLPLPCVFPTWLQGSTTVLYPNCFARQKPKIRNGTSASEWLCWRSTTKKCKTCWTTRTRLWRLSMERTGWR